MNNQYNWESFPLLKSKHVRMKDKSAVLKKINKILADGAKNLQVVSDYDRTMTKQHVEGEWNLSSFGTFTLHDPLKVTVAEREDDNYQFSGIFEQSKLLPNEVKEECKRMLKKYRPMEVDESLPMSKRIKAMEEWMEGSRDVIKGVEYPLDELENVVEIYGSEMRDNIHDLFEKFEKLKVPVLVFSAGLGDVIKVMLKKNNMDFENIEIISNFLKYKGDVIQGFVNEKMIHVFNKNEHAIEDKDYFQYLKNKHNALLMGDTTGDAAMTDGIDTLDVVLKIGFLYEEMEQNLPNFMEKFDIVLIDDQTMNVPLEIFKWLA